MDRHTFNGKRKVGSTELTDFTDIQGIGRDPLYKRFSNVRSVTDRVIDPAYAGFLATPNYDDLSGRIGWYIDDWEETPVRFTQLPESQKAKYSAIKDATLAHYRSRLNDLSGEDLRIMGGALRHISDEFIFCADGKVYAIAWGMAPDKGRHVAIGELIHEAPAPKTYEAPPLTPPAPAVPPVVPPVAPPPPKPVPPVVPPPPRNDGKSRKPWPWWWWLLAALGLALLTLLILWLSGCFRGCGRGAVNGVVPLPVIEGDGGQLIEDNGWVQPIDLVDGRLPEEPIITAPVIEDGGVMPEIIHEPGLPPVMADRLILFLEDENASLDDFAAEFKRVYPGDRYSIIGYDQYVKSLTVKVPADERLAIKNEIEQRIPGFRFFVFDESVYEINQAAPASPSSSPGWHLDAVKAHEGWQITKGSRSVKVAVVDDGIDPSHNMFSGRIVAPYNVFTRDNRLSKGIGHGTMVAGLAVGSLDHVGQGAAGIAPDCSLIPVQVADNGVIPLSATVSGIMYAVFQDADVINVSIGPQLQGLNILPIEDQISVSQNEFVNVAKLWGRVCKVAASKNSIIVFAAGNDDILSSIPPENRAANCVVVGAVNEMLYPTDFTNYGFCTDISAPGSDIYSSFPTNSYNTMDGTSFSAPIVSGVIALMRSLDSGLTVKQAQDVLYRTGKEVYGFMPPMVQIPAALQSVKDGDFSRGPDRAFVPVPGSAPGDAPHESWIVPGDGSVPGQITIVDPVTGVPVVGDGPAVGYVPGTGIVTDPALPGQPVQPGQPQNPAQPGQPGQPQPPAQPAEDYSFIRNRIKQLKQEIRDLEQQLPENQR